MHIILPIDTRYNKWRIVEYWGKVKKNHYYKVVCDCGFLAIRNIRELRRQKSRSCRPCSYIARTGKRANMEPYEIGTQINQWTILSMHLTEIQEKIYVCKCKCGFIGEVKHTQLNRKKSTACRSCSIKEFFKSNELIGQTFGKTKILQSIKSPVQLNKKSKGMYFIGQCLLCNRKRIIRGANIKYFKDNENACNRCAAKKRNENKKAQKNENI